MILIFTDLDGTLLDHESYTFDPALPAIGRLKELAIPLILASSKTEAEMRPLAKALTLDAPMIVENGSGVIGLEANTASAPCYDEIRDLIHSIPATIRRSYESFGDWDAQEIAKRTGLPVDQAALAGTRKFSEPGIWNGTNADFEMFETLLSEAGFQITRGGRFATIMRKTSKADAMKIVAEDYAAKSGEAVTTVALGDAPNDVAMLEAADHGFIISNPAHDALPLLKGEISGKIKRSKEPGPVGWNAMVGELITSVFKPA